jgi:hypothetical protein
VILFDRCSVSTHEISKRRGDAKDIERYRRRRPDVALRQSGCARISSNSPDASSSGVRAKYMRAGRSPTAAIMRALNLATAAAPPAP